MKPREDVDLPIEFDELEDRLEALDPLGRRFLTTYNEFCTDHGGEDSISAHHRELIRRAAFLHALCTELEHRMTNGERTRKDVETYLAACRTAVAMARTVGLKRTPKEIDLDPWEETEDNE